MGGGGERGGGGGGQISCFCISVETNSIYTCYYSQYNFKGVYKPPACKRVECPAP